MTSAKIAFAITVVLGTLSYSSVVSGQQWNIKIADKNGNSRANLQVIVSVLLINPRTDDKTAILQPTRYTTNQNGSLEFIVDGTRLISLSNAFEGSRMVQIDIEEDDPDAELSPLSIGDLLGTMNQSLAVVMKEAEAAAPAGKEICPPRATTSIKCCSIHKSKHGVYRRIRCR